MSAPPSRLVRVLRFLGILSDPARPRMRWPEAALLGVLVAVACALVLPRL